jgi:hypothetical protein
MRLKSVRFGFLAMAAAVVCLVFAYGARAQDAAGQKASTASVATPHLPDGQPDLSGMWNGRNGRGGGGGDEDGQGGGGSAVPTEGIHAVITSRRCAPNQTPCDEQTNQTVDQEFTSRVSPNRPLYKPEFWDKVQDLDKNTNYKDPIMVCQPYGVPRVGPPVKIMQNAKEVVFFYAAGGAGTQPEDFRIIPTNNPKHDPVRSQDITFYGDSVGHWEGDTLVIDSVGFNDITWLDRGGYFHSDLMHVIEKLHRDGNTLTYSVTVDDPQVLVKPWDMTPRTLRLNMDPNATIHEGDPCHEEDAGNISSGVHH